MKKTYLTSIYLLLAIIVTQAICSAATAQASAPNTAKPVRQSDIEKMLRSEYFERLYSNTYYSLVDRMDDDGYLQESLTGAYEGMFPRTTGALVLLYLESGRLNEAQQNIQFVLDAITDNGMERIPRIIGKADGRKIVIDDQHQIDGQAHVVLAWARLASNRGHTPFEDRTWAQISAIMNRTCDRTAFQYGNIKEPTRPSLVKNIDFEHSKEVRAWDVWDLLTQSFVGASLEEMSKIADRRGEHSLATTWRSKIELLKEGINTNLITTYYGIPTYVEMLQQTPSGHTPYCGLGWVTISPVAAGWEGADRQILRNTVAVMNTQLLKHGNGVAWMPTDGYPDGKFSNEIIGKGMGWEIDFARTEGDFRRIGQILHLIQTVNGNHKLFLEGAWLGEPIRRWADVMKTDADYAQMQDWSWQIKDAGNGEQTAWWCWAMCRLRKSVGMSAEPKRY